MAVINKVILNLHKNYFHLKMKSFRRFIIYLLIGFMSLAEGLSWDAPFLDNITCKDKSTQIDKIQELNSLVCRSSRISYFKKIDIKFINNESFTYSFTNVVFCFYQIIKPTSLTILTGVFSFLHLLQLY